MAEFETTGFVLKRQNFGEADRLLKIFTRDLGLVTVLAKGVRKPRARFGAAVELFNEISLRLYRRTSEIFLLIEAGCPKIFGNQNLKNLRSLFLAAEILLALNPPEKKLPKVYSNFYHFLNILKKSNSPPFPQQVESGSICSLAFTLKTLTILGFFTPQKIANKNQQKICQTLLAKNFTEIWPLKIATGDFTTIGVTLLKTLQEILERDLKTPTATLQWF